MRERVLEKVVGGGVLVLFAVSSGGEGEDLSPEQYLQCATLVIIPPHRDLHLVK